MVERVTSRWMVVIGGVSTLLVVPGIVGGVVGGQPFATVISSVVAVILVAALSIFSALSLEVDAGGLHAAWSFGLFPVRVARADIAKVEAAPYQLREFLGWGLRFSLGGAKAYSVIGVPGSLRVTTRSGATWVFSSRDPEALIRAIGPVS
jgi:hypothetical protein